MDEECIKRDLTMQAIRNIRNTYSKAKNFVAVSVVDNILGEIADEVPAADVAPVIHGHWIICSDGYYPYCSVCKREPKGREMTKFCGECGAKMDEFLTELNGG